LAASVEVLAFAAGAVVAFCAVVGACAEGAAGVAAIGLCGAAGACADGAVVLVVVLEAALGGVLGVDGLAGVCAQTGAAIASTAASATPLNKWFIVFSLQTGEHRRRAVLMRSAISFVFRLTVEWPIGCSLRAASERHRSTKRLGKREASSGEDILNQEAGNEFPLIRCRFF